MSGSTHRDNIVLRTISGGIIYTSPAPSHFSALIQYLSTKRDLTYADLSQLDLARVNLSDVNLRNADLSGTNLTGAKLSGADLRGANLSGAKLVGATATSADLRLTRLDGADLSKSCFTRTRFGNSLMKGATLGDATFAYCNMCEVDLTEADLQGTKFPNSSLESAVLDQIRISSTTSFAGTDMRLAKVKDSDIRVACWDTVRSDMMNLLGSVPAEVPGLLKVLDEGHINGTIYEAGDGGCCCLVGTVAKLKGLPYKGLPDLKPDNGRLAERFAMSIGVGDTPANSPFAALLRSWILEWCATQGVSPYCVSEYTSAPPPTSMVQTLMGELKQIEPNCCLFGGALRDAQLQIPIKDYDIRIWTDDPDTVLVRLVERFGPYTVVSADGTPHVRYLFTFREAELDISLRRPIVGRTPAQDRARDSDVGLSAVAMDTDMKWWCREDYLLDLQNGTLTLRSHAPHVQQYAQRLRAKYPDTIIL